MKYISKLLGLTFYYLHGIFYDVAPLYFKIHFYFFEISVNYKGDLQNIEATVSIALLHEDRVCQNMVP